MARKWNEETSRICVVLWESTPPNPSTLSVPLLSYLTEEQGDSVEFLNNIGSYEMQFYFVWRKRVFKK